MVSARDCEQIIDSMVLANTAKDVVIDKGALVRALDSGKVASVGPHVYEQEPSICWGTKANPNVVLLPHMKTWTVEVNQACFLPFNASGSLFRLEMNGFQ